MLTIYFKGDDIFEMSRYDDGMFTEYECNSDLFVVKNDERWVGIYPMELVHHIEYVDYTDNVGEE